MARTRKQRTQKLFLHGERRGVVVFDQAYTAIEAARAATKMARKGYKVKVTGTGPKVRMTCEPKVAGTKTVVTCSITPAFKKQVKGLAGVTFRR